MAELFHLKTQRIIDSNGIADGATLTFYDTGTLTKRSVYTTEALSTAHPNPLTVAAGAALPNIYLDGSVYRCIVRDADGNTIDDIDPYLGLSSLGVLFTQAGTGAVARSVQARLRDTVSVFDFIPVAEHAAIQDGTTTTDVTSYVEAAMTAAEATAFHEKTITFPAGTYRVSQWNLRDRSYLRFHGEGTVNITGVDGAQGWIVGDDRFDDLGHTEDFTQNVRFSGGPWLIGPLAGQTYARGLKLQNVKDSVFENVSVSGTYTPTGGTGDRKGVEIELSFNNQFYNCDFSYAGAPIGADKSYALFLGSDNVNNNRFFGFRVGGGPGAATANTIGVRVDGSGNAFFGADISAIHTCFELNNARGALFSNVYHEAVAKVCTVTFASTGCVFLPAYVDIAASGIAYDLSGAQTKGFAIIGGNHKFNASGTTGLAKGSLTYGLIYQPGFDGTNVPATAVSGTDNGAGGASDFAGHEAMLAKLTFPETVSATSNGTTLNAYNKGQATISNANASPSAPRYAQWRRIGDEVICHIVFVCATTADTNTATFTGLPFSIDAACFAGWAPNAEQTAANTLVPYVTGSSIKIKDMTSGTDQTNANISGKVFAGTLTYRIST